MLNDGSITLEDLKRARAVFKALLDIRATIEAAYTPVKAVDYTKEHKNHNGTLSDPTSEAVRRIADLEARFITLRNEFVEYQLYTLDRIKEPEIQRAVNMYYFCGFGWKETNIRRARMRTEAYIRKHAAELNSR